MIHINQAQYEYACKRIEELFAGSAKKHPKQPLPPTQTQYF